MQIGDVVTYAGRRYLLVGVDPMSVPDRCAHLEDPASGERLMAPICDVAAATDAGEAGV